MVTLDLITPAIAGSFKAVRLRALLDSPSAFGATHAKEMLLTDSDWQSRATQWNGERSVAYLAMDGDEPCGIVAGVLDDADATTANLASMWVAPSHRKLGVGKQLVDAIIAWAYSKSATTVFLMVTNSNLSAIAFYERVDFVFTGLTKPYPNDSGLIVREMQRALF